MAEVNRLPEVEIRVASDEGISAPANPIKQNVNFKKGQSQPEAVRDHRAS